MKRHPLDPIPFVAGVVAVLAGLIALAHQIGAISLGLPAVVVSSLVVLGSAAAALVVLDGRRSDDDPPAS